MKIAIHKDVIGKPVFRDGWLWCGNKRINLGYGWINADLTFDEVFVLLAEGGAAICPAMLADHRIKEDFVSHQIALVDIDSGMQIEDLANNWFYQLYGGGYYTTSSHTPGHHKFRIIYKLVEPITDAEEMCQLYEGLMAIHGAADPSCKDAARLFYGTVNAAQSANIDTYLPPSGVSLAISQRKEKMSAKMKALASTTTVDTTTSEAELVDILNKVKSCYPVLPYRERFVVTAAVSAHVSKETTISLMRSRWDDSTHNGKYEDMLRRNSSYNNGPTVGTLMHMIRQVEPDFRKKSSDVTAKRPRNASDLKKYLLNAMSKTK